MMSLLRKYNKLKYEFETYQKLAEDTIQKQSIRITELDKKLDMLSLVVEISEYINRGLGNDEITSVINDIMIGILGVTYSSVYLLENRKLKLKDTNLKDTSHHYIVDEFNNRKVDKLDTSLVNSNSNICNSDHIDIHSSLFMPIYIKSSILGLIIVEHNIYNYLNDEHITLLTALTNHIAICLENNRLYNQLKESSQRDYLTGLFNRNYFFSVMERKYESDEEFFAIIMVDIDNFKCCNDDYGHQYGDIVLRKVCSIIKSNIRREDIAARYGGEEIILYLYDIKNPIDVYKRMETIRKTIEGTKICHKNSELCVTVSIGIGIKDKDESLEQTIKKADVNLYRAKNLGKNKVVY